MSKQTIYVKKDDSARTLIDTLLYSDGTPIDLTNANVKLVWTSTDTNTNTAITTKKDVIIVNATLAQVSYHLTEDDVKDTGDVLLEWEITFLDETQITVPTKGQITLKILPTLD